MTVSVVIPTYNRPELLTERAIPSVLAQDVALELIVVGDGTDAETCRRMAALTAADPRVRFENLPHQEYPEDERQAWGLSGVDALNWGWDHATGDWLAVLGDDDEFVPGGLAILLAEAERTGADVVYGRSEGWRDGKSTGQVWGSFPVGRGNITDGANIRRRTLPYRYAHDCWDRGMEADADLFTRMASHDVPFALVETIVHRYWQR